MRAINKSVCVCVCAQLQATTKIFVRQMEAEWGATFPEGRNADISFMAHVWEDLRVLPKPLALHLASEAASLAGGVVLRCMGFRKDCCQVRVRLGHIATMP